MSEANHHPNRVYPWEIWFKKKQFTICHGQDYACMTHSMAQQVRTQAAKRNIKVQIRIKEDPDQITVTRRYRR